MNLFEREISGQKRIRFIRDLDENASPALLLGFNDVRGERVQRIQMLIEVGNVLGEVNLARDCPGLGFQFSQQGFLFSYAVEIKEGF